MMMFVARAQDACDAEIWDEAAWSMMIGFAKASEL